MEFFVTGGGNAEWPENSLVSEDEIRILMTSFMEQHGEPVGEDDIMKIIRWVERMRLDSMLLDLVLEGQLNIDIKDGEFTFSRREEDTDENGEDEDVEDPEES